MAPDTLTANNLVAAERDGEYGLTVQLRVDKVERTPDHDWWAQLVHCSDVLGTHVKLTVFDDDDCDLVDYSFEEGTWYEFDDVNPDVYQGTIGIKAKWDRQVRQLCGRPEMSPSDTTDIVRRLGAVDALQHSTSRRLRLFPSENSNHQTQTIKNYSVPALDTEVVRARRLRLRSSSVKTRRLLRNSMLLRRL